MARIIAMACLATAILFLLVSGCSGSSPTSKSSKPRSKCIDGVVYIYYEKYLHSIGWGFMSVKFNPDSTVVTCK